MRVWPFSVYEGAFEGSMVILMLFAVKELLFEPCMQPDLSWLRSPPPTPPPLPISMFDAAPPPLSPPSLMPLVTPCRRRPTSPSLHVTWPPGPPPLPPHAEHVTLGKNKR